MVLNARGGIGQGRHPLRGSEAPPLMRPGWFSASFPPRQSAHVRQSSAMSFLSRGTKKSNFSIEHILNVAGGKQKLDFEEDSGAPNQQFDWLNCTRYRPPKLPRQRKKEGVQRRNLGRNPRIPFSSSQVAFLEAKFLRTPYLSSSDVTQLASYLKLSETKVKIWFQNRRAREKREKETKSKAEHNSHNSLPASPPTRPTPILPLPSPDPFPLHPAAPCHHIPCSAPPPYLQGPAPLDLSERRFICRPK